MTRSGLSHDSTAHQQQYTALSLLFATTDGAAAIATEAALVARLALYVTSKTYADDLVTKANASTAGITDDKKLAKRNTAKPASVQTGKGASYAITKGNTTLEGKMKSLKYSKIFRSKDADFSGVIQDIKDTLTPFITSDAIISAHYFTAPSLANIITLRNTFLSKLGVLTIAEGVINGAKADYKLLLIPQMSVHIQFMKSFMDGLKAAYPDFVNSFAAIVKKIDDIGKRNQGVDAAITKASDGNPFGLGVTLRILNYPVVKIPKIKETNSMGDIPLLKLKIGVWTVQISAPGFITQTITITVEARKVVSLNIAMVAV